MAQNSKIEWTHHTANLWHGCTKVHEGCDHCYAETLSHRWGRDIWGNDKPRMEIKSVWNDLKKYQALAAAAGEMHRVFVGSMMDIFEKPMPLINSKGEPAIDYSDGSQVDNSHLRERFFEEVIPQSPNLLFLLLTKRPSNINKYIPESWKTNPPENVMFGTSPVNQKTADKLIPQLLKVKGKKFISCEPLLGPINLRHIDADGAGDKDWCQIDALTGRQTDMARPCEDVPKIDWVIVGGESGHGARPMHPDWVGSIRDQCEAASVPFLFKQWGEFKYYEGYPIPLDDMKKIKFYWENSSFHPVIKGTPAHKISCFPLAVNVGKKEAGRLLDGKTYDEFPKIELSIHH
jgi:protein gp37